MTSEKFQHFMIVSDINSIDEIRASGIAGADDIFAVVISTDREFPLNDSDRQFLRETEFLTFLYSSDMSGFSADFIMQFDMRISGNQYIIDGESFSSIDMERYTVLCGRKRAWELEKYFSGRKTEGFSSGLVKVISEPVSDYCTGLFKEKSADEVKCLTECLTAARSGRNEDVFSKESHNFYRMVSQKVKCG